MIKNRKILVFLALCLTLSGCGVKPSFVDPPPGVEPDPFPRTYPSPATDPKPQ